MISVSGSDGLLVAAAWAEVAAAAVGRGGAAGRAAAGGAGVADAGGVGLGFWRCVPAREIRRRGAGDLRDQVGDRHAVGVAVRSATRCRRLSGSADGLRSHGAAARGGSGDRVSHWLAPFGVGRARATRSGVIAVTHVPTGLRPYEQRARRCASAAALPPPELKRQYPWPRDWSQ